MIDPQKTHPKVKRIPMKDTNLGQEISPLLAAIFGQPRNPHTKSKEDFRWLSNEDVKSAVESLGTRRLLQYGNDNHFKL